MADVKSGDSFYRLGALGRHRCLGRQALGRMAVFALLAGCVAGVPGDIGAGRATKAAPTTMALASGTVIITGPSGYCVDTSASRDNARGAFVLLGSCASLTASPSGRKPQNPAILTASVVAGSGDDAAFAASFPAMARFLSSSAGRAALSRSGQASSVQIVQITSVKDVMYIRASDRAAAKGQEVETEYWRALMSLNGKIITLSVLGLRNLPMKPDAKRRLLESFVARVRAANNG